MKFYCSLLLFLALLFAGPAGAETDAPDIGCNAQGCSIYVLEYAWPDVLEINALDFFRVKLDVNQTATEITGSIQYFGVLCRIPGLSATPICPLE